MKKFIALVPMKANSVRVRNKNIRDLSGFPLFYHIIKTLERCRNVSGIYVNTDSEIIKEQISKDFKNVNIIDRPEHLRLPAISMNEIIAYDLTKVQEDYFIQTHATNPLLKSETIDKAIEVFTSQNKHDTLFSVTKILKRFYNQKGSPINHNIKILLDTQNLEPLFEENSCIYIFTRQSFERSRNRIGINPLMYEIEKLEAVDIDDEYDFFLVKQIYKSLIKKNIK